MRVSEKAMNYTWTGNTEYINWFGDIIHRSQLSVIENTNDVVLCSTGVHGIDKVDVLLVCLVTIAFVLSMVLMCLVLVEVTKHG